MTGAPLIELPAIRQQGYDAMQRGMWMRLPGQPMGFCFNPYEAETTEAANFSVGCSVAVFGAMH